MQSLSGFLANDSPVLYLKLQVNYLTFVATSYKERLMSAIKLKTRVPGSEMHPKKFFTFVALMVALWSAENSFGESLYPVALMNWMVEGNFHALIVDKSQQRLTVWRIKDGEPSMIESYRCSTGENDGDKWVRGDMRNP